MPYAHPRLFVALCALLSLTLCGCPDEPDVSTSDMSTSLDMASMDADVELDEGSSFPEDSGALDLSTPADTGQDAQMDLGQGEEDLSAEDTGQDAGDEDMPSDMGAPPCLPPGEGEVTIENHPSDGWRWVKGGRVFPDDTPGLSAGEGDFSPSLIEEPGGGYRLYFARRSGGFELYTTTSADGVTWEEPVRVQGIEQESYPSALRQSDGRVRLWYGSGSIAVASSPLGEVFTEEEKLILTPSQIDADYAKISLTYPDVREALDGSGFRMWFTAFSGQELSIGEATSPDGVAWTALKAPVLTRRAGTGGFDNTSVGQPEVHIAQDALYMWHGGYDTSNTNPGPWRVGLSRSMNDGVTWVRQGVTLPLAQGVGDDMWSTRDPAVLKRSDGSGWLMVYVGMRDDSIYRLLTATSDACVD